MTDQPRDIVSAVINGGVALLPRLLSWSNAELEEAASVARLTLTSATVASVLSRYRAGDLSLVDTQRWAGFVRWGDLGMSRATQIDIEYETLRESAILTAIGRMDELGDAVDGDIDDAEARKLIADLQA